MALVPDIRLNWRNLFSSIANCSFLVDTAGWSVVAGFSTEPATSLTRVTGDGVLGGVPTNTCAEFVTTANLNSSIKYVISGLFPSGRPYRVSVWLKSVSGTTSARIAIGSFFTPADRTTSNITLTTSWARYSVDWTPSADRTDVEVDIGNNAAAIMTARICLADVYEAIDDIGAYGRNEVTALRFGRGASFDGSSEGPGSCALTVRNDSKQYVPANAAGPFYGLLEPGADLYVRVVDTTASLVYGGFYGPVRRFVPMPRERMCDIMAEDVLQRFGRAEVNIAASTARSIRDFRIAILDAMGESVLRRDLAYGPEIDVPYTGSDRRLALGLLDELNTATGSIHYINPHPSPDILYQYKTVDRTQFATWASAEHVQDTVAPGVSDLSGYDVTDEARVTFQRVTPTVRQVGAPATVWTSWSMPFDVTVDGGPYALMALIVADGTVADMTLEVTYTGTAPVVTFTPYASAGLIGISSAGATTITRLAIVGSPLNVGAGESVTAGSGTFAGPEIQTEWLPSVTAARGLAAWQVYRYAAAKSRPTVVIEGGTTAHTIRDVGEAITLTFDLLSLVARGYFVRSKETVVTDSAMTWITSFALEEAPATLDLFTVNGTAAQGVNGTGGLGY